MIHKIASYARAEKQLIARMLILNLVVSCWLLCPPALVAGAAQEKKPAASSSAHDEHQHHRETAAAEQASESTTELKIPDVELLDQDGKKVRFYSDLVKDKIVAINFIFTTCTTICPPMGVTFGKVQDLIGDRLGTDVRLISVSVDPVVDTPERLRAWAAKFKAEPGWSLVTGPKPEVDKLLRALGGFTARKEDHSPVVLIGDAGKNKWTRASGLASPAKLNQVVQSLIDESAAGSAAKSPLIGERKQK